jgi:hypothetical protein
MADSRPAPPGDDMARRRFEPKDYDAIFAELDGENDRAAIAVGGSILEHALEQAILSRLREPNDNDESAKLFSDVGIFGTFYEKIWLQGNLARELDTQVDLAFRAEGVQCKILLPPGRLTANR